MYPIIRRCRRVTLHTTNGGDKSVEISATIHKAALSLVSGIKQNKLEIQIANYI